MIKVIVARTLFIVIFILLGALAMGWWTNKENIANQQLEKINSFISAGPRFTAKDGDIERQERKKTDQELCERIAELEKHSIGFQQSGIVSQPCNYFK